MNTFESALESWECVLFNEIIFGYHSGYHQGYINKNVLKSGFWKWVVSWKMTCLEGKGVLGTIHFMGNWKSIEYVYIFGRKGYQADRKMRLHNGHYILGISIFSIFWSLKVRVILTKARKWSRTCMKVNYCPFESLDIIFCSYEILGTIWVPCYGCIEV